MEHVAVPTQRIVSLCAGVGWLDEGVRLGLEYFGVREHLWPAIPKPTAESELLRLADGRAVLWDASRADRLRCAGNGCVALQAAAAFIELMRRVNP